MSGKIWKILGIVFVLTFPMAACQTGGSVSETTPLSIVRNSVAALKAASSFRLESSLSNQYSIREDATGNMTTTTTTWNSTRSVDMSHRQIMLTANVSLSDGLPEFSVDEYVTGGWEYTNQVIPRVAGGTSWTKTKLTDDLWRSKAQIDEIVELLQTSASPAFAADVSQSEYYVLDLVPQKEAMVDWVMSQDEPNGAFFSGPQKPGVLAGAETFTNTFKQGTLRVWIDKRTRLVNKADISARFEATPNDTGVYAPSGESLSPGLVISVFQGEHTFYDYNGHIEIKLPQETSSAREY